MTRPDWCPQDVWEAAEGQRQNWAQGPGTIKEAVARAILAERERCRGVANERAAQLLAAIQLPITDEAKSGWAGQMIEALMIEQRISQGHQPKQSIDIEGLHAAAKENGFPL